MRTAATATESLSAGAIHVRERLKSPQTTAINALKLFDGSDISTPAKTGQSISIHGGVIEMKDSEGYSKYDSDRGVIEILASEETYARLEQGHPRAGYFVIHEMGHCLLHTDLLVRLAQMMPTQQTALHRGGERPVHDFYRDTEWQANAVCRCPSYARPWPPGSGAGTWQ